MLTGTGWGGGRAYHRTEFQNEVCAHRNYEVAELLKFWTEKIMEIATVERERPRFDSRENTGSNKCAALK